MLDVMSIRDEPVACFGPPCSDPFPSFWFTPLTPVQLARPDDRHQDSTMNMFALNTTSTLTMSSREITELTGKRHGNVMRDIRSMLEQLGLAERSLASSYQESTGRLLPCFNRPKDEATTLVSGYSVALRASDAPLGGEPSDVSGFGPIEPNCCGGIRSIEMPSDFEGISGQRYPPPRKACSPDQRF